MMINRNSFENIESAEALLYRFNRRKVPYGWGKRASKIRVEKVLPVLLIMN